MVPWTPEWKNQKLAEIYNEWKDCRLCQLHECRQNVVFGAGNPDADIMLVGEAPGEKEDDSGWPFVGDSGELLQSMVSGVGLDWDDLYVTNVVACRPPKNRDPIAKEKDTCLPRVMDIIYIVDPLVIVPIGKYALNALLSGRSRSIEAEHGKLFSSPSPSYRVNGERNGVEVPGVVFPLRKHDGPHRLEYDAVPIYHPSYILRQDSYDPKTKKFSVGGLFYQTMEDLESVVDRVEELKDRYEGVQRLLERLGDAY